MAQAKQIQPTLAREMELWKEGYRYVAGIDEAGRGALAGPVVAAAVVVPPGSALAGIWEQVQDSKQLTALRRTELATRIRSDSLAWGVGAATAHEIDQLGIAPATRLAMQRAISMLQPMPLYLLIDWVRLPMLSTPQESPAKADGFFVSVAAASILAKVHRDQLMNEYDLHYPRYGFARHKGYGTARHLAALGRHGPCAEHRLTFAPLATRPDLFDSLELSKSMVGVPPKMGGQDG
jgi:ribonuclease HII